MLASRVTISVFVSLYLARVERKRGREGGRKHSGKPSSKRPRFAGFCCESARMRVPVWQFREILDARIRQRENPLIQRNVTGRLKEVFSASSPRVHQTSPARPPSRARSLARWMILVFHTRTFYRASAQIREASRSHQVLIWSR